jgi:predicted DNA-binding transcriptional regulator YafY
LLDSYRTNLTGLTRDEVRALFMLSVPTPLMELGVDQDLQAALLKLSAALPDVFRHEGVRVQERIHLDSSAWLQQELHTPHLHTIQRGLWENCKLELTYQLAFEAQVEHLVEPYGLVAKANLWYLIFSRGGLITVLQLADVLDVKLSETKFSFPTDFDLVKFWSAWCLQQESNRPHFRVQVRIKTELLAMLKLFRDPILPSVQDSTYPPIGGWQTMTFQFETFEEARKQLLNFGSAVEIIEPLSLRKSVQDYAEQIIKIYTR